VWHLAELNDAKRNHEVLELADEYEGVARALGDERTVGFVMHQRMNAYAYLRLYDQAGVVGESLLVRHRAAGNVLGEAKLCGDLAEILMRRGRFVEGMRYLARAGLLLENTTRHNDRFVSALWSYAGAAHAADLWEEAASCYEQLAANLTPAIDRLMAIVYWPEIQLGILLTWGLRLEQLGYGFEASNRLRRAAAVAEDWRRALVADPDREREAIAAQALALAKLGQVDEAIALAEPVLVPLREQGRTWAAWSAHIALGVGYRARGELVAARRELLAALGLTESHVPADARLVTQHELAMLTAQTLGADVAADLVEQIRVQARLLWEQRQQRRAMLRQARQQEELEMERARTDAALLFDQVTGLGNRRRFDQLMSGVDGGQLATPISLLVIDVDKFKAINDTHSHSAGDYVLRELGTILKANCRPTDPLPIRCTDDEFVVFLHGDLPTAVAVAKGIREAVAATDFDQIIPGTPVTVSAGVATLRPGMTAAELFRTANANLFQAKLDGRDRVIG
jgi:diguanylate cyclase (GGDEF)-like protein